MATFQNLGITLEPTNISITKIIVYPNSYLTCPTLEAEKWSIVRTRKPYWPPKFPNKKKRAVLHIVFQHKAWLASELLHITSIWSHPESWDQVCNINFWTLTYILAFSYWKIGYHLLVGGQHSTPKTLFPKPI